MPKTNSKAAASAKAGPKSGAKPVPEWLVRAMQGVVFWMGLKRAYYKRYKLSEGALVDELTSLLAAALGASGLGYKVTRELKRERLVPSTSKKKALGRKPAVDIAVERGGKGRPAPPIACIEVKRAGQSYLGDIDKLARYRANGGGVWRGFVLVIAERKPSFVTEDGFAPKKTFETSAKNAYAVRRVCKALTSGSAASRKSESGYWACVLELV
jgi:hypothetical protein